MWHPRDNSAGRSPSLLQALGLGHLGEVVAQGPSFEAVLAQSPGSALPQLLSGDHHLRSVVLLRCSLLQRSTQRLHAGLRAAAGRGHRAAHGVKGKEGGLRPRCGGRDGCGEDVGSRSPPLRSRRRSVAAIRSDAAPWCGWHGVLPAARFALRQDGQSRATAAAPSLRCIFPLFGSRWSIPHHNSHHALASGSQPLL